MSHLPLAENRNACETLTRELNGACRPGCPVCGGPLFEIRAKLQCAQCHTICETCCEGARG